MNDYQANPSNQDRIKQIVKDKKPTNRNSKGRFFHGSD